MGVPGPLVEFGFNARYENAARLPFRLLNRKDVRDDPEDDGPATRT
jgi:hypothetical protein